MLGRSPKIAQTIATQSERSAQIPRERALDLDRVEGKAAQMARAGIAGAEIVHRDAGAEFAQSMQGCEIGLGLRQGAWMAGLGAGMR